MVGTCVPLWEEQLLDACKPAFLKLDRAFDAVALAIGCLFINALFQRALLGGEVKPVIPE